MVIQSIFSRAKSKKVFNSHVLSIFTSISVHVLALFLASSNLTNALSFRPKKVHKTSESIQIVELESIEEAEVLVKPLKSSNIQNSSDHDENNNSSTISKTSLSGITKDLSIPTTTNFSKNKNDTFIKDELEIKPDSISTKDKLKKNEIIDIELPKKNLLDNQLVDKKDDINNKYKTQPVQLTKERLSAEKHSMRKLRQDQITKNLLEETLKGAEKLIYNHVGTQRAEARQKDIEWMQRTGIALKLNQMITIEGSYPKSACNLNLKGSAVYNIFVNKNGKLNGLPFMTQSSGYGILNDQGLDDIKSYNFSQPTRVRVIFEPSHEKCPNLPKVESSIIPSKSSQTTDESNNIRE